MNVRYSAPRVGWQSLLGAALAAVACGVSEPSMNPMDLAGKTASVGGFVVAPGPDGTWVDGTPMPDVIIEIGTWDGTPYTYRDTVTRDVAATPDDPRFTVIATGLTDHEGKFSIPGLPKHVLLALRARPPPRSPFEVTYFVSLFGLAGVDTVSWPMVLRKAR